MAAAFSSETSEVIWLQWEWSETAYCRRNRSDSARQLKSFIRRRVRSEKKMKRMQARME